MRVLLFPVIAVIVVTSPANAREADAIALERVIDAIVEAYNHQNVDELVSLFHPEVGYLVPSRLYVDGREAVRAMYEETFTRFRQTNNCGYLRAVNREVVIVGVWAWVRGESQFVVSECGSMPAIPSDLPPGSKHLGIYKKENGEWLRYRQVRNGNTPDMNF